MSNTSGENGADDKLGPLETTFAHDEEDSYEMNAHVAKKWQGTVQDRQDMTTLGRVQELRRNFRFISLLGFGCTLISTWEIIVTTLGIALTNGGTAGLVWGYIAIVIGFTLVYMSVAEMASMAPTSGGQYHWVSEFAPRSCQRYLTGWLCFTGWQGAIVSISFLAGTIIQGLLVLNIPTYVFERWHGTMLVIAISTFAILFNTFLAKKLPLVEGLVLVLHVLGLFAIIIPLWILAPRNNSKAVFTEFSNNGGWSSTGTSTMIGLITPIISMLGFDCSVHMSEEVKDAGRTLPRAMMWSVGLNAVLGFIMVLTLCYTLGDQASILASATGYPFIQVFFNVTNSFAGTNAMTAILIITLTSSCISEIATASRQLWSFARDNGVPFSAEVAKVTPGWNIPLNAVIVSLLVTILLSLINIGSTAALNAILSLTTASLLTSYCIIIFCVLLKRIRGQPLPARRWSLGRYGSVVNVLSLCFLAPIFVFSFFPATTPVVPTTMNWAIVMYGGMIIFSTGYYFLYGKHVYTPPVTLVHRDL
ncbi:putative GABA permease [Lepidopterella palustris CBS 459.81]|uniref:Putative GABA permease n=1 Tax=Lepidopterella palustris CBS 459.81 TaxID=1314670 RepID=A0A8E2JC92_9PEZI|nr:putative GABA permease [Lepidopterella palustris CBS 459.81]